MAAFPLTTTPMLILPDCLSNVRPIPRRCQILQEYHMSWQTAGSFHTARAGSPALRKLPFCKENMTQRVLCHCLCHRKAVTPFCYNFMDDNNFKSFFILRAVLLSHLSSVTENLDSCVCWLDSQSVSRPYSASLPRAQARWWGSKDREERGTFTRHRCAAHT